MGMQRVFAIEKKATVDPNIANCSAIDLRQFSGALLHMDQGVGGDYEIHIASETNGDYRRASSDSLLLSASLAADKAEAFPSAAFAAGYVKLVGPAGAVGYTRKS